MFTCTKIQPPCYFSPLLQPLLLFTCTEIQPPCYYFTCTATTVIFYMYCNHCYCLPALQLMLLFTCTAAALRAITALFGFSGLNKQLRNSWHFKWLNSSLRRKLFEKERDVLYPDMKEILTNKSSNKVSFYIRKMIKCR